MLILGLESSCDETAVSLLENNDVLVNLISSQAMHEEYGGVVPEFASREHMKIIQFLVERGFAESGKTMADVDAIAVTRGPGLMGALLVGLSFAKGLSYAAQKPMIGVNHVEGHIMANFLDHRDLEFPFTCLLISGGHSMIVNVQDFGKYEILGRSVDDAAGEAFDKAARILNLPYPGGPQIDKIARGGNVKFYHFTRAKVKGNPYDFSFSGLKTAILYLVKENGLKWAQDNITDLCASYQETIVDMLQEKVFEVMRATGSKRLVLAGGVAANSRIRQVFKEIAESKSLEIYFPSIKYCTDNAAMIARTGAEMFKRGQFSDSTIAAIPNLRLA